VKATSAVRLFASALNVTKNAAAVRKWIDAALANCIPNPIPETARMTSFSN
jgi:hypothetical protein